MTASKERTNVLSLGPRSPVEKVFPVDCALVELYDVAWRWARGAWWSLWVKLRVHVASLVIAVEAGHGSGDGRGGVRGDGGRIWDRTGTEAHCALFSWLASLLRSLRRRRVTRGVRVRLGQAVKGSV